MYLLGFAVILFVQTQDSLVQDTIASIDQQVNPAVMKISDPWFSQDKFLHLSVSTFILGATYYLYRANIDEKDVTGKVFSVSFTAGIGLTKELYDRKKKDHFSWKDLFFDGAGLAIGYLAFIRG